MRDSMVILPMFMGCGSPSDVLNPTPLKPHSQSISLCRLTKKQERAEERLLEQRNSKRYHSFPRSNIVHKLIQKSTKSFSQVFVSKEQGDEDEDEAVEMEIGAPTDVKHVSHIGIGECDTISSLCLNNISAA